VLDGPVTLGDKEYPHALITGWENGEVRYFDPVNGHIAGYFNEFDNVVDGETVFHQVRMLKLACGDVLVYSRQADRGELYFVKDDTRVGGLTLALAPEEEEVEPGPIRRAQLLDGNTIFLFSEAGLVGRWDGESGNCQGRWRTAEGLHAGAAMPHGVLVTVHGDRTLRIWDPGELDGGERIRQLEPGSELPLPEEAGEILGVEPVEDRGFITRHENGIVVWFDREAGQSVVTARERDLAAEHPALLGYVPRKLEDPNLRLEAGPWRGYAFSSRAVLTRVDRPAEAAWWYGPGQTRTLGLKENGRMQLTTGPVAEVLQLYRGAEPVPLDDLEAWREEQPAAVGRRPARALRLEDVASPGVVQGIGLAEEERRRLGHASLGLLHILQVLLRRNRKLYARIAGVEDPWALLAQVQKQLEEGGTGEPVGLEELAAELRDIAARRQSSLAYEQDLVRWLLARMGEDTA
jgi:hypothetical protein